MRVGSMDPIAKDRSKSHTGYYLITIIGAIVLGFLIMFLWDLLKSLFALGIKYWYVAIIVILVLLFLRKRRRKKA